MTEASLLIEASTAARANFDVRASQAIGLAVELHLGERASRKAD
jgi:hypothetical protein